MPRACERRRNNKHLLLSAIWRVCFEHLPQFVSPRSLGQIYCKVSKKKEFVFSEPPWPVIQQPNPTFQGGSSEGIRENPRSSTKDCRLAVLIAKFGGELELQKLASCSNPTQELPSGDAVVEKGTEKWIFLGLLASREDAWSTITHIARYVPDISAVWMKPGSPDIWKSD